jgi:hypothetical protein
MTGRFVGGMGLGRGIGLCLGGWLPLRFGSCSCMLDGR